MHKIYLFPNWTTNPYLNLLTLEARADGWQVDGGTRLHEQLFRQLPNLVAGDVFHIHWTGPFDAAASTEQQFVANVRKFESMVLEAKARGVFVLWTVHNLATHDARFPDAEQLLAEALCSLADRIIVLNSHTSEAAKGFFDIPPNKVSHIPHSSYSGVYPDRTPRKSVQRVLGVPEGLATVGFVGAVRPYKGVGDLLKATAILARRRSRCGVIIAGETNAAAMREVESSLPFRLPSFRQHSLLTDEEIALWMSACDVLVLPYRGILNSGSMMLAATFGVPVVLPSLPHLVSEYSGEEWIRFFDASLSDEDRWEAIADAVDGLLTHRRDRSLSALDFAASFTPLDMAYRYSDLLASL